MSEPLPTTPTAHLVALTDALGDLNDGLGRLRRDVRADATARHRESLINIGVIGLLALMVLLVLVVSFQNNQLARQNKQLGRTVQINSVQIRDCTQPGGACYEEGRRRTGDAVGNIVRSQVYITECAKITSTDDELERCVAARLSQPTPTPTR